MNKTQYSHRTHITISIPRALINEVKELIHSPAFTGGYRNHSEFCIDAIRRRLEDVKREMETKVF